MSKRLTPEQVYMLPSKQKHLLNYKLYTFYGTVFRHFRSTSNSLLIFVMFTTE